MLRPVIEHLRRAELDEALATMAARASEHDRTATFPHEAFDALRPTGALSLTVPTACGGGGGGLAACCELVEALGRADASVALVVALHSIFHSGLAHPENPWPADVRERVQRSAVEEGSLVNALRVEPELGTPARGGLPATVATRRADGGWRLSGHKIYTTGIPRLRWLAVWARTQGGDAGPGAGNGSGEPLVGTFLVEAGTPGYRVEPTWDHLGMRATRSDDVIFTDVEVPAERAVALAPAAALPIEALDPAFLAWNNLVLSSIYHGVALAARDWLVGYLNERTPTSLGAPLATLPRFQQAVGEIEALLHANGRLIHGTAAEVDDGPDRDAAARGSALVKRTATANAIRAVEIGISLIGNPALSRRNPLERHYRDVLCSRIHTPQDDTIVLMAGRAALATSPPRGPAQSGIGGG
jgi:alkylation response protein AidB-like acyl-CoA dehydrogenase